MTQEEFGKYVDGNPYLFMVRISGGIPPVYVVRNVLTGEKVCLGDEVGRMSAEAMTELLFPMHWLTDAKVKRWLTLRHVEVSPEFLAY